VADCSAHLQSTRVTFDDRGWDLLGSRAAGRPRGLEWSPSVLGGGVRGGPETRQRRRGPARWGKHDQKTSPVRGFCSIYVTKPSLGKCAVRLEKKKAPERMFYYARAGS
jgi:hypothetical protein